MLGTFFLTGLKTCPVSVKRPKAIGLDRPQGPKQCFITCLTISKEKSRNCIALFPTVWATDKKKL